MKAEDTVIKDHSEELITCPNCHASYAILYHNVRESQAEISFKAGRESLLIELNSPSNLVSAARQEGIKEVVEWGLETCPHDLFGEGTQCYKRACDECWNDKVKEWGV